jgi:glutaredoxin-like protein NrdH
MADKKPFLYTLSTCVHCSHTKDFLKECGVDYDYIDVDQLQGDERQKIIDQLKKFNPALSFPTILVDDGDTVIVGFKKEDLKKALEIQ